MPDFTLPSTNRPAGAAVGVEPRKGTFDEPGLGGPMSGPPADETPNPVQMLLDRMHGRWLWAILLGLLLAPAFAFVGFAIAPVKYRAQGILTGVNEREFVVESIAETEGVRNFDSFLGSQAQLIMHERVISAATDDERLRPWLESMGIVQLRARIAGGIYAEAPRRTNLIVVSFESDDPDFSAAVVNSVVDSYIETYSPNAEAEWQQKTSAIKRQLDRTRDDIRAAADVQNGLLEESKYGDPNVERFIEANVQRIQGLDQQIAELTRVITRIEESARLKGDDPQPEDVAEPTTEELDEFEPMLVDLREQIEALEARLASLRLRFGEQHHAIRTLQNDLETMLDRYTEREIDAEARWYRGPGKDRSLGKLDEERGILRERREDLRAENAVLRTLKIEYDAQAKKIEDYEAERTRLNERLSGLLTEESAVKESRMRFDTPAVPPPAPTSDKRIPMAAAGAFGAFGASIGLFFLIGSLDRRAYAASQLEAEAGRFRCIGVVPDTGDAADDPETVNEAMMCVHRLRNRIESTRAQTDEGYAIMVSSPFQGDGKTTLTTLLGWSYAESGFRTCLVDFDFIGRALTHQFGRLHDPGVREVLRQGNLDDCIVPLGNPNLNLLAVGVDRTFDASHVHVASIRQLFRQLRQRYDVIITDCGPMIASLEALPLASSVDGVLLALRKGRSRKTLGEAISDLRSVGAGYLGVVLNCADRADYSKYTSLSRMSDEVQRALAEGRREADGPNPLIDQITRDGGDTAA